MNRSEKQKRHFLFAGAEPSLPIVVESIGYNPTQETFDRAEGYPCFHWLQTTNGEGVIEVAGQKLALPVNTGILLFPHVKHYYAPSGEEQWSTVYITFEGPQAAAFVTLLGFRHSEWFRWEEGNELGAHLEGMLNAMQQAGDRSGLDASSGLYRFLILLKKHGQIRTGASLFQHMEKLNPLLQWLDRHYDDPALGLPEMAEHLGVSARYLNVLFRRAFGMTAYTYLIRLRLTKAKELISGPERLSITQIAQQVGYRDVSHFIAVFGKAEGMTPEQFRKLH